MEDTNLPTESDDPIAEHTLIINESVIETELVDHKTG